MKRAFTLIELLVVIAIIAILAAILFPVFAQAKEAAKKTATLAQYKQMGTSVQIYIADSDDTLPLSMSFNTATRTWRWGNYHAVPNGWSNSAGRDVNPRREEEGAFVLNSIQPYVKSYQIYKANGLSTAVTALTKSTLAGAPQPAEVGLTYNGILHGWSATAVASPSKLPLFWMGNYKENVLGATTSNPVLYCARANEEACRFNPGGSAQPGGGGGDTYTWFGATTPGNSTVFVYGKGMPFIAADTSARFIQFNAPKAPQYAENANTSPWSQFSPDPTAPAGSPYWISDCNPSGPYSANGIWPGYFRPDSEFNYTAGQCQYY